MTFTEKWFPPQSCDLLADLAQSVADVRGRIVEVGSWEGRSTVALANAIAPRVVHAVDTWKGSPGEPSAALAAERDVYATWRQNIDDLTAGNVVAFRMPWREYAETATTPVALVFIDAEHTYTEVRDTIQAFLPHVQRGGVICGDDAHHGPVREAVLHCLPSLEVQTRASMWWWRK